jgi:hypothetical protein
MHRWIQVEKARYYQALLGKDLFGEWTLITAWRASRRSTSGASVTGIGAWRGMKSEGVVLQGRAHHALNAPTWGHLIGSIAPEEGPSLTPTLRQE